MTFIRENAAVLGLAALVVAAGVVAGLVVGVVIRPGAETAAVASPSPSPSVAASVAPSPSSTPGAAPTPSPTASPIASGPAPSTGPIDIPTPMPPLEIPGADPDVVAAIEGAIAGIGKLDAYRGETETLGRDLANITRDSRLDMAVRADVVAVPIEAFDAQVGFRMVESDDSAAISSGGRLVRIGDEAWVYDGDQAGSVPVGGSTVGLMPVLLPRGAASRMVGPFAGGYERVGPEERDGVESVHYRLTDAGEAAYAAATGVEGDWAGDVWIAADGGYLVEAHVTATTSPGDAVRDVSFLVTIKDANAPDIRVERPA